MMEVSSLPAAEKTRRRATRDASPQPGHCAWCGSVIPIGKRRDSVTCSQSCRQARHRFRVAPAAATIGRRMRAAYADPPYPGLAQRYYGCPEVDHAELVARLERDYPDGWALSTSAAALPEVIRLVTIAVRVCAWFKGGRASVSIGSPKRLGARNCRRWPSATVRSVGGGPRRRVNMGRPSAFTP